MIGRRLVGVALSVTTSLAVTTCDIQANPASKSVAFPRTSAGGCVDTLWGWRVVDEDGTVLVERSFEQEPVCSGDALVYKGNDIVREAN